MTAFKFGTDPISDSLIFDDSNMKLIRHTKIQTGEGNPPAAVPNRFTHALSTSAETITPEALSRIVTGLGVALESIQTLKFKLADFSNVMRRTRELGAAAGCHETGIAARMYTKREIKSIIIQLQDLYRKY
ncbi:hypothetical protein [Leptospira santarosai]|uniref:Uncharacterized protein n=2 Tax=Leptospira santarosai TaxID=28183 RepID=A0AB73LWL8_9LEPT|nr:hypothetical protein [Leptospira santarosai]MDI7164098.1 hypothetical protein [Leptospira santarosai]MDO6383091.1 hypothetical protein [Leptospira santarosai]OLY62408.1 hypothetical protein BWD11_20305 [Leptospira santarosai serovar Grippotyphosa]ONF75773.1 hypothetical protein BWD12_20115 [Leptospira santarosai serovar Bananal]ONF91845.1 hypothetical protein BWD14_15125 [Leptospira santarosai]